MTPMTPRHLEQVDAPSRGRTGAVPNVNPHVSRWIERCVQLCEPDHIHWCDGSAEERRVLLDRGVDEGILVRLNQEKLPGCYLHRSNPNDVARTEQLTFICTPSEDM